MDEFLWKGMTHTVHGGLLGTEGCVDSIVELTNETLEKVLGCAITS